MKKLILILLFLVSCEEATIPTYKKVDKLETPCLIISLSETASADYFVFVNSEEESTVLYTGTTDTFKLQIGHNEIQMRKRGMTGEGFYSVYEATNNSIFYERIDD